jgi:hypothetical protein
MTDNTLNNLNSLENKIIQFGEKISEVLEIINKYQQGEITSQVNEKEFQDAIDKLTELMFSLKEDMHKRVDEIYKDSKFEHLSNLINDFQEQKKGLDEIKFKLQKFNFSK